MQIRFLKSLFFLLLFNFNVKAQSKFFKSAKDNFITTIGCTPEPSVKYGMNDYSCNNDKVQAIYSVRISKIGDKGNLSGIDIDKFFNSYIKDLNKANIYNYKFITYKGLKTIEYTVSLSSYGAWLKQIVLIKLNKSYSLTITARTKAQVENLMYSFKKNFRFIND